jgi:GINS complex subunit 3
MSYYDVDAILTDSQKLPCTFELDVPGLGYLEGNAGGTVSSSIQDERTLHGSAATNTLRTGEGRHKN